MEATRSSVQLAMGDRQKSANGSRQSILSVDVSDFYQSSGPLQQTTALYKIAILGASGVGKSSIALDFLYGRPRDAHIPTIEDIYTKQVTID